MDPITVYAVYAAGAAVTTAAVWYARGAWDKRKATLLPRLVDAGLAIIAEIKRLEQADPASEAARKAADAANAAKVEVLMNAAATLKV